MSAQAGTVAAPAGEDVADRSEAFNWRDVAQDLDARGSAVLERLLSPGECQALAALYPEDSIFRSRIVMGRHGFGRGEYKYFSYPLPDIIESLRTALYQRLAPIANRWNESMGIDLRYRRSTRTSSPGATRPANASRPRSCSEPHPFRPSPHARHHLSRRVIGWRASRSIPRDRNGLPPADYPILAVCAGRTLG